MRVSLVKEYGFEAAHRLPLLPPEHKCFRLHGHSFRVEVVIEGELDPKLGWLVDYDVITRAWQPLHEVLDHNYLNDVEGLENPTSEILAHWIFYRLEKGLPGLKKVVLHETCTARCEFTAPPPSP